MGISAGNFSVINLKSIALETGIKNKQSFKMLKTP